MFDSASASTICQVSQGQLTVASGRPRADKSLCLETNWQYQACERVWLVSAVKANRPQVAEDAPLRLFVRTTLSPSTESRPRRSIGHWPSPSIWMLRRSTLDFKPGDIKPVKRPRSNLKPRSYSKIVTRSNVDNTIATINAAPTASVTAAGAADPPCRSSYGSRTQAPGWEAKAQNEIRRCRSAACFSRCQP
jgi:hypothetical protein